MRDKGEANAREEIGTTNKIYGAVKANTIGQTMGMKMNGWNEGLRGQQLLHIQWIRRRPHVMMTTHSQFHHVWINLLTTSSKFM